MVKNILQIFGRELKSVHQAAFLLAFSGVLADVLALFRDRLLASEFGASRALDLYYVSFRVPDLIYTFSLFFAASTALMPILLEKFSSDEKSAQEFLGNIFSLFGIGVIILVLVFYVLMPYIMPLVAPGFSSSEQNEAANLSRILLLSPLFLGLSNLVSSVVQSFRRFFVYALSPILYNAGIIFGIIFIYPSFGVYGIIWGVVLGAFLHLAIQLPTVNSLGFSLRPKLPHISPDVIRSLKLSAPRTLGLSLNQLVLTAITALGSIIGSGAVAIFNFASNLQAIPLSIIGLSYSLAAFPTLAASYAHQDKRGFLEHFSLSLRHIVFWSLPATVLFIVLRAQVVRAALGAGAFSWVDTRLTAASLYLFALSILSQGLILLLVRAFYAAGRTKIPLIINIISSFTTLGSIFLLMNIFNSSAGFQGWFLRVLRVDDLSGGAVLIFPLAISLGSAVNIALLLYYFRKTFGSFDGVRLNRSFRDVALSSVVLGVVTYYALQFFAAMLNLNTFWGIFLQGLFSGLAGVAAGVIVLKFLKNAEFLEIASIFKRSFWTVRVPVVAAEPEKLP